MTRFQVRRKIRKACSKAKHVTLETLSMGKTNVPHNTSRLGLGKNSLGVATLNVFGVTTAQTTFLKQKLALATTGALFIALGTAAPSMAASVQYSGTTVGQSTWNRPIDNGANPPTSLSGVGTNVSYSVQEFSVDASGLYNFLSDTVSPTNWDNYLFLYQNSFNPTTPLTNAVIGNDDFNFIGRSAFNDVSLTAGRSYFLVTTGYNNDSAGSFTNTVSGSGNITLASSSPASQPVPEPLTILGSLAAGSFGVALRRKYNKQEQKETAKV
jgi:hypothetical protein